MEGRRGVGFYFRNPISSSHKSMPMTGGGGCPLLVLGIKPEVFVDDLET